MTKTKTKVEQSRYMLCMCTVHTRTRRTGKFVKFFNSGGHVELSYH